MGCSLDVVPTLWACYAIFGCRGLIRYGHLTLCGHKGLSDWVLLKNVIDKSVTVYDNGKSVTVYDIDKSVTVYDNGKSVTVYDNGKSVTRDRLGVVGLNPTKFD